MRNTGKTPKGGNTRRRIIETAAAMMAEDGPDAVSMRVISLKLGITKPVLYYHFKDKEDLIRAAFAEGTKPLEDLNREISGPGIRLEQRIEKIFSVHLELIKRHPETPKCALQIMSSPADSVLGSLCMSLKRRNRESLRRLLEAEAGKEGLSKAAISAIIHMVGAVISHFMIEAREKGLSSIDKRLPAQLARLVCAGARALKGAAIAALLLQGRAEAQAARLGVEEAVQAALRSNTSVINAERNRDIYKERIDEYWGGVYPQLSASAAYTRNIEKASMFFGGNRVRIGSNNSYAASLDLNQVLWAGGRVRTGLRMADIYSGLSDAGLMSARAAVRKSVSQLYYSVLLSKALADIQKETLDLSRQHLATIEEKYRSGLASDLAVLRQKVEVSNAEPAVTENMNMYYEGLLMLLDMLGMDPDSDIELTGGMDCRADASEDLAGLYAKAMASRPEYRAAKLQRDLAAENVTLEKSGHYPNLYAFASRQFQGAADSGFPGTQGRSWALAAGVKLSLPLFSGGAVSSRVAQSKFALAAAEENLKEAGRSLKISVKKAWLTLNEAVQRRAAQETTVATARKALAATETRFRNGLAGQLEMNDATLALNKAQVLFTRAQHDVCSAQAELDWAAGR